MGDRASNRMEESDCRRNGGMRVTYELLSLNDFIERARETKRCDEKTYLEHGQDVQF